VSAWGGSVGGAGPHCCSAACRLQQLEGRVLGEAGQPRGAVCDLTSQVESFKKKLEVRHSWMLLL